MFEDFILTLKKTFSWVTTILPQGIRLAIKPLILAIILLIIGRYTSPILSVCGFLIFYITISIPNIQSIKDWSYPEEVQRQRRVSLYKARAFLAPYKNIMGNHTLSNKYCTVKFTNQNRENRFFCISKLHSKKDNILPYFEVVVMENLSSSFPTANECFDALCNNFSYNTKLDDLHEIFSKSHNGYNNYILNDSAYIPFSGTKLETSELAQFVKETKKKRENLQNLINKKIEIININNASEAELTALPGINVIQAKKIINFRDYEREFSSIEDFFRVMKIKKHFHEQLKSRIKVEPVKKKINKKTNERIIDID